MKNVIVVYGGISCEHDISVITGVLTYNSIDKTKYNPIPVYIDKDGLWWTGTGLENVKNYAKFENLKLKRITLVTGDNKLYIVKKKKLIPSESVSVCINCLHGIGGEDGSLSGLMKLCKIAIASPNMFASSAFMDKDYTKILLDGLGIKRLPHVKLLKKDYYKSRIENIKSVQENLGYPVIVKPANLGSSIGISIAKNNVELMESLDEGFRYDNKVIIEKAIKNFKEINCACYKDNGKTIVSECEEPYTSKEILTFCDKYLGGDKGVSNKKFPADIDKELADKIKETTALIYEKTDCEGVIRVDYMVISGEVYLNEVNTIPGSLAYYLFVKSIKEFSNMLTAIIERSLKLFYEDGLSVRHFKSNVLEMDNIKGKK